MVENQQWSAPSLEQVAELSMGILPREFSGPEELKGASKGYWPTPQAADGERQSDQQMRGNPTLLGAARLWPTPSASVSNDGESPETWRVRQAELKAKGINGNGAGVPLAIAAQEALSMWATPNIPNGGRAMSAEDVAAKGNTDRGKRQVDLGSQAAHWATPSARDWRSGDASDETMERNARPLNEQATHWSTPLGSEARQGYKGGSEYQQSLSTEAVDFLSGPLAQPIAGHGKPFSLGGRTLRPQLSALFVEWLMGLPLGWSCVCATGEIVSGGSATQLSRSARKRRSGCSGSVPSESTCE